MSSDKQIKGVIAYCDGGAIPSRGPTGSGVHGYVYHYPVEKEKPTKFGKFVATAQGYIVQKEIKDQTPVCVDEYFEYCIPQGHATNNVGEIRAVSYLLSRPLLDDKDELLVISDSKLVINGVNDWMKGWISRNWTLASGDPVANVDDWKAVLEGLERFASHGVYKFAWVLGHNDDFGNTQADLMASAGVNFSMRAMLEPMELTFSASDYHKVTQDVHPFLCLKRVYFNTSPDFNTPGLYYLTDGTDEKFIFGKRTAEAVFSVVKLNYPDKLVETAIKASSSRITDVNTIVYSRLDRLRQPEVMKYLDLFKEASLSTTNRNLNMNFLDKKPVVVEVKPDELPLRAVDVLTHLEEILEEFQTKEIKNEFLSDGTRPYQCFDITDHFYDTKTKRQKQNEVEVYELKKAFGVGVKDTELSLKFNLEDVKSEFKLTLLFGTDLPNRNTLKRLEDMNPMILLTAWQDGHNAVRYAVIVKTDEAAGIWSNYFANLVLTNTKRGVK